MFNFVCHAVYYLELLFGKIISTKSNIFYENKNKTKILKAIVFFNNGLSAKLNIMVGLIKKSKPTHQLKIISDQKIYLLKTKLNSLSDKFSNFSPQKTSSLIKLKSKSKTEDIAEA